MDQKNALDAILIFPPPMERIDRLYPAPHFLSSYLNSRGFKTKTVDLNMAALLALATSGARQPKGLAIKSARDLVEMEMAGRRYTRVFRHAYMGMFGDLYHTNELSLDHILAMVGSREMERMADLLHPVLAREIISHRPRLVGFSIPFSLQFVPAVALAGRLKALMDSVEIWFGGPVVTLMPCTLRQGMLKRLPVDKLIRYGGEYPLAARLKKIKTEGQGCESQVEGAPEKLSSVDTYDFNRFSEAALSQMPKVARIPIRQSSGCYWQKCTFCDYIYLHRDKAYRPRKVEKIMADIEYYTLLGFRNFRMLSEAIPPAHALALAEAILKKAPAIKWHAFIRVDKGFTLQIFKTLKKSGFTCTLGMESASDRILAILNKGYDKAVLSTVLDRMKTAGFDGNHVNIMVGVPGETQKDAWNTFEFCTRYKAVFKWFKPARFTLTATSYMGRHPEAFGITVCKPPKGHSPDRSGGRLTSLAFDGPTGMNESEISDVFKAYASLNQSLTTKKERKYKL